VRDRIGTLVLWHQRKRESAHLKKVAEPIANVCRNGDSDGRRLKSRFGNADRSSVSLLLETG
jgi:hypothetical protein